MYLLIKDTGPNVIAASMQLIAGRTGQDYNARKGRHGAFWEDRYHATAIETDEHLHRCLAYIDLNMVRAGVVDHPIKWVNSGYHEIQQPPKRYRVIDLAGLLGLCSFSKLAEFQQAHRQWVEIALRDELSVRDARWSEAVAVGSLAFVEKVKSELGIKANQRSNLRNQFTVRRKCSASFRLHRDARDPEVVRSFHETRVRPPCQAYVGKSPLAKRDQDLAALFDHFVYATLRRS